MLCECVRRLKLLKVGDKIIFDFKEGKVPCYDTYGNLVELSDEDKKVIHNIDEEGATVYAVIYSVTCGVFMRNYLVTSAQEEDWDKEFSKSLENCYGAYAYVTSELTHEFPDHGDINVSIYHGLHRTDADEARAYSKAHKFEHACRAADVPKDTVLAGIVEDWGLSDDENVYYNGELSDDTPVHIWNGSTMELIY